jgi:hypothetical protein
LSIGNVVLGETVLTLCLNNKTLLVPNLKSQD